MMVASKRERFPLPRARGCCRFGQRTFAGASGNDEDAPKPVVRLFRLELSDRKTTGLLRLSDSMLELFDRCSTSRASAHNP